MPTLYTTLRARHRHSLLRQVPPPEVSPRSPRTTLLAGVFRKRKTRRKATKVAVIGAGFAGLCAAYELDGLGYDVTVFDARNRVGGRVHSLRGKAFFPGKTAEGGGELIGSNHPLWNSYARHFGLGFSDAEDYGNSPIRIRNKTLPAARSQKLIDEMEKVFKRLCDRAEQIVDPFEPWANSNAQRWDRRSLAGWLDRQKCSRLCKDAVRQQLEVDNGVSARQQSLLGVLAMIKGGGLDRFWNDTEVYRCEAGNQQLAEKFRDSLNDSKVRVRLSHSVTHVEAKERIDKPDASEKRASEVWIKVKGKRRTLGPFDDLILAIPPSVWHTIIFKNRDLARKLRYPPAMGANVKYLMQLEKRFWQDFGSSPNLTEDGPVNLTWETTEADDRPAFTMVAFSGAKDAIMLSRLRKKTLDKTYDHALEPAYPGISSQIKKRRFVNWPKEEWSKASYYFPRPGHVTKWGPLWRAGHGGWFHFAGEHTCFAFMGYMEGALNSGFRLARRLAVRDGLLEA